MSTPALGSIRKAIQLNNDGISFALNGQGEEAIACFSQSLGMFKQVITSEGQSSQSTRTSNTIQTPSSLHSTSLALPLLRDSGFFLFNRVLCLSPTDNVSPEDNHIYCAVIILNLAVLHHQTALRGDSHARRSDAMRRAERFYDMVTGILSNQSAQPTGIMARLAALNNLAHIRMEKGDFMASENAFQMLAWLVNMTKVEQTQLFNENDLEGMMLNVLMANRRSVAPAA